MTATPHPHAEAGGPAPAARPTKRWRWQVGLRTLFLLMAAVAVWMAHFVNRQHNATLEARIKAMTPLARELVVHDPKKIAIGQPQEYWFDEDRWELYLPPGRYRLCLATRKVDETGFAPVTKSAPLATGKHRLTLEQQRVGDVWRVIVRWDQAGLLVAEEPKGWHLDGGGSIGGAEYSLSEQPTADKLVVLFRQRFLTPPDARGMSTAPTGPTEGVLLWVERAAGPVAQP